MEDVGMVGSVARAVAVALDWSSSPDARKSAYSYLESVESGDVRILASTAFHLVKKDWSSEIRLHSFKMLQHLVRLRWDELNPTERRKFSGLAVDLMTEMANPSEEWALKSQSAALVAEIIRREGVNLWQELLPSLVSLSNQGPIQAESVSMMLRWLPEDIMVHNEDLESDRRRLLLRGLTQSLPEVLPLLYNLLERHFGAALAEVGRQQLEIAKQHATTVTAILNAVNSYAEWAPLPDLAKYGIIHGCGFMLSSPDFRLHACEFFKLVCPRKRPIDGISEYDSAITQIFQILMKVSSDLLNKTATGAIDESEMEFAEYLCESMVSLGSSNLQSVSGDDAIISLYFRQMLGFFQHHKLVLHCQSIQFWLALMRELLSKPKVNVLGDQLVDTISSGTAPVDKQKSKLLTFVNEDFCQALLDTSFQRMLRKEKVHPQSAFLAGGLELWSDDIEGKGDFGQHRNKLLELIRFVATHKPLIAVTKVSERIVGIVHRLLLLPNPAQELAIIESMQLPLENIVGFIFDGLNEYNSQIASETQLAACGIISGLLQQLLSLKWTEPDLAVVLGHYLDALGPFLKYNPDAVRSVINKLFELLTSLPCVLKDPTTNAARHARLQICTSFIRIAKAADKSLLPHMKDIADTMAYLQKEGRILRGEHNLLAEAFLIMASTAGVQQQHEVLAWLLEPLGKQWTDIEWQNAYLSDPSGFIRLFSDTSFMWSIFHTLTFFEKALKRSGSRKGNTNFKNLSMENSSSLHPMASHLQWMLPPLFKLLRAVHCLWSPTIAQALPGEVRGAMIISDVERSTLLGDTNFKLPKGALTFSEAEIHKEGYSESSEIDIRNWLKGIRDSGYNVVGLAVTIGDYFFKYSDSNSVALALLEHVQSMEFRHLRQLVHSSIIPLVISCPSDKWDDWLDKLLHPLLCHFQQALSNSWCSLLQEGRAKVPDRLGIIESESDLRVEVMEEKLLRILTREFCSLLATLGLPGLNSGLPSLELSGHVNRVAVSSLKELRYFTSSSMIGFLLNRKSLAVPALQISVEAFKWTDGESVAKVCSFCNSVVHLAVLTNNFELQEFVCKSLYPAVIQGLALESNAVSSHELVGLCRDIFVHFVDRDPAPRQILLSLPSMKMQDLAAFEDTLSKTSSAKEQRQLLKCLLLLATGNQLKALAAQKSVNVITNVSMKDRNPNPPETGVAEGESIGLATIS